MTRHRFAPHRSRPDLCAWCLSSAAHRCHWRRWELGVFAVARAAVALACMALLVLLGYCVAMGVMG